jgi:hypothetical protein
MWFIALVVGIFFKPENQLLSGAHTIKLIMAVIDTAVLQASAFVTAFHLHRSLIFAGLKADTCKELHLGWLQPS